MRKKKNKLILPDEALAAIATKVHAKIDYEKIIQGVLNAIPKPKDGKDLILTEALRADFADQIATLLPKPKDGKPGLSHQEKEQIRADITEKVQKDVKLPDIDDITKRLGNTFVTKGLLRDRMEALTRFIKRKTPVSAGISGGDMVDEITKVLGEDWQSGGGGAVESVDGRAGIVTLGDLYEPLFSKNSAFNKNFGAGAGQVAEGNALAAKMTGPGSSQINQIFVAVDVNGNAKVVPAKIDDDGNISGLGNIEHDGTLYRKQNVRIVTTDDGKSTGTILGGFHQDGNGNYKFAVIVGTSFTNLIETSGIGGLVNMSVTIHSTKDATSLTNAGFLHKGGGSFAKNLHIGTNAFIHTVKSGATQGGAGAAIHEIWKTSGHATLPDNVLMIGV